jgi:DNA-binding LytR/AlgR family response regulator
VEGFELNLVDYLLKPVSYERFLKAVSKVRNGNAAPGANANEHLFLKSGTGHEKLLISEIDYIEAKGNYLLVHTQSRSVMTYLSLKKAEELLPQDMFIKVHKSYMVNIHKITRIESNSVCVYNKSIPLSRSLKEEVTGKLLGMRRQDL